MDFHAKLFALNVCMAAILSEMRLGNNPTISNVNTYNEYVYMIVWFAFAFCLNGVYHFKSGWLSDCRFSGRLGVPMIFEKKKGSHAKRSHRRHACAVLSVKMMVSKLFPGFTVLSGADAKLKHKNLELLIN